MSKEKIGRLSGQRFFVSKSFGEKNIPGQNSFPESFILGSSRALAKWVEMKGFLAFRGAYFSCSENFVKAMNKESPGIICLVSQLSFGVLFRGYLLTMEVDN